MVTVTSILKSWVSTSLCWRYGAQSWVSHGAAGAMAPGSLVLCQVRKLELDSTDIADDSYSCKHYKHVKDMTKQERDRMTWFSNAFDTCSCIYLFRLKHDDLKQFLTIFA